MVISFTVFDARHQLLTQGVVYTFRWTRRSHFKNGKEGHEKTWATKKRGQPRMCNVIIEEMERIPIEAEFLDPYVDESGFDSAELWYNKIFSMSNPYNMDSHGYIYRVTLNSQQLRREE